MHHFHPHLTFLKIKKGSPRSSRWIPYLFHFYLIISAALKQGRNIRSLTETWCGDVMLAELLETPYQPFPHDSHMPKAEPSALQLC
jgi:hypothetical protein